jgi:ribosomal peptide maturation radical SAM protein 1
MEVVFAVLPFADIDRPAIGVSLLQAELEELGFEARVEYLNFDLAEQIGIEVYAGVSHNVAPDALVGEWFFADLLFELPTERQYVERILARQVDPETIGKLLHARRARRAYIERCVARIRALQPRIVGFTTTFHQTCGCLAVAKRLKELPGAPLIVFGGANCEGEMGLQLLKSFAWIDYTCTREGDIAFPRLVQRLLRDGDPSALPGILRQGESRSLTLPAMVQDLDALPIPQYRDYFARLATSPLRTDIAPSLLIETSRGCWWGAKQHCTFCGLNGDTMSFRGKSAHRAYDELAALSTGYSVRKIECVDNILDMRLLNTLMPRLACSGLDLDLFYEIKANLRYDQVVKLRAGGVTTIQPGIESFSDRVLHLMRKGCTGMQNIQLLRWCAELGIRVAWNLLAGFPGEDPEEYSATAALIPLITHLPPPASCSAVRLDRFSPMFTGAEEFGLTRVRPNSAYYYVFPLGVRELANLAYFFEFDYADARDVNGYFALTRRAVDAWAQAHVTPSAQPVLDAAYSGIDEVVLTDTRPCAIRREHRLQGLKALIYYRCDTARTPESLARQSDINATAAAVRGLLGEMADDRLVYQCGEKYLSLAVMRRRPPENHNGAEDVEFSLSSAANSEPLLHPV